MCCVGLGLLNGSILLNKLEESRDAIDARISLLASGRLAHLPVLLHFVQIQILLHLQLNLLDNLLVVYDGLDALLAAVQAQEALRRARHVAAVILAHLHLNFLAFLYQVGKRLFSLLYLWSVHASAHLPADVHGRLAFLEARLDAAIDAVLFPKCIMHANFGRVFQINFLYVVGVDGASVLTDQHLGSLVTAASFLGGTLLQVFSGEAR